MAFSVIAKQLRFRIRPILSDNRHTIHICIGEPHCRHCVISPYKKATYGSAVTAQEIMLTSFELIMRPNFISPRCPSILSLPNLEKGEIGKEVFPISDNETVLS